MRGVWMAVSVLCVCLCVAGCSTDEKTPTLPAGAASAPEFDADAAASALVSGFSWPVESEISAMPAGVGQISSIVEFEREVIGDVAHYRAILRTGPGMYDQIGLHRVVRESAPYRPIRTRKAIFLQHGASSDFAFTFLPGQCTASLAGDFGAAVFLARSGIDVWGIDQAWCLVPPEVTDYTFMRHWGIPRLIRDLDCGVRVARLTRLLTGNGWEKMILLGWSFGAEMGFGLLDGETQLPSGLRQIKAFIPVDMAVRAPQGSGWREFVCSLIPYYENQLANGIYGEGAAFRPIGLLAREDPDGESPFFPGLTNLQAAVTLGTTPPFPGESFHLLAGVFEGYVPVGMRYLSTPAWVDLLCTMSVVEPNQAALDQVREICTEDVPWNRHWGQIRVPVFYVAAAGGWELGLYQLDFLGSHDISTLVVSTDPPQERDFGHIDLWSGSNAPELVWPPIRDYVLLHSPGNGLTSTSEDDASE